MITNNKSNINHHSTLKTSKHENNKTTTSLDDPVKRIENHLNQHHYQYKNKPLKHQNNNNNNTLSNNASKTIQSPTSNNINISNNTKQ